MLRTQQQVNVAQTYGVIAPQTTKNGNYVQNGFQFDGGNPAAMASSKPGAISTEKDAMKQGLSQFISPNQNFVRTQSRQGRNNHSNTNPNQFNLTSPQGAGPTAFSPVAATNSKQSQFQYQGSVLAQASS